MALDACGRVGEQKVSVLRVIGGPLGGGESTISSFLSCYIVCYVLHSRTLSPLSLLPSPSLPPPYHVAVIVAARIWRLN